MNRIKEFADNLRTKWDQAEQEAWHHRTRMIVATAAAVAILLPWLPIGEKGRMSGSQLLTYGITSPELGQWMGANPLGTILFVAFGALMITVTLTMAWRTLQGREATAHQIFLIVMPFLVIATAETPIFDQNIKRLGLIPIPQAGLLLMITACAGLLGHTALLKWKSRAPTPTTARTGAKI